MNGSAAQLEVTTDLGSLQVYLASVSATEPETPNRALNILVVLASSTRDAARATQGERGKECRIELQSRRDLPVTATIERLGLLYMRARVLA
jgi:hypothetical protein